VLDVAEIVQLYDRSETDELGIRLTAEEMGVELGYLPFYKVAVTIDRDGYTYRSLGRDYKETLEGIRVVLNRTQSKNRRLFASFIMENLGKEVLNPLPVELFCQSKIRTALALSKAGIRVPRTTYIPCNVMDSVEGRKSLDNSASILQLIASHIGEENVVVKPDAGTHGRGVCLAENGEALSKILYEITPSVTNPAGVVAQELIPKWFYDLRIIVSKEKGKTGRCHPTALARGGFKEFRTNTFLGNMVFRAQLPASVRREAERCAEVLSDGSEAWVIALDAMPYIGEELMGGEDELRESFSDLEEPFQVVKKVKKSPTKKREFRSYTSAVTNAYKEYMATEAYARIEGVVNSTLRKTQNSVYFHEGNACPEFWEQTRVVGGINLAIDLLSCAQSLMDR
jgi:glutathione synthase/RimK-type ligase-like ATP-grasp enzyme